MQIVPASCPSNPHYSGECSNGTGIPPAPPYPNCVLHANPEVITTGQSSTLSWNTAPSPWGSLAPPVGSISPGVGPVAASGQLTVRPIQTTTYTYSGNYKFGGGLDGGEWIAGSFTCSQTVSVQTTQACPAGEHFNGANTCVCDATGQPPVNGQCIANSCLGYYCSGPDLHYSHASGAQCIDDLIQHCAYGCTGSACLPPPKPTVTITAKPSLVHESDTTQVTWSSTNTTACTVTSDGGDAWTGLNGTQTSKPLLNQTTFTLTCTGIDGSSISAKAVVDVIPKWQEQ